MYWSMHTRHAHVHRLDCRTGSMQANLVSDHIEMELNFQSERVQSVDRFNYLVIVHGRMYGILHVKSS